MEQSAVFIILVILASSSLTLASVDDVTIHTTHGDVRGQTVWDGRVKEFWGIPYAKIPARFQRPERMEAWKGVLDATTPPPSCPEVPYNKDIPLIPQPSTAFDEDCLYLNLWVPVGCADKGDEEGLALMVWIHGGALQFGSSTVPIYNGQALAASQCVIVASLNYRLGVLGFLSLGTAAAPGNVGMLDQVLALQWINHNARHLGGSPDRITIFGESAGGVSVAAHMVSPLSRHLFSRVIIQSSGTPMTTRWLRRDSENAEAARKLAGLMGCSVHNDDAMMTCLSQADSVELGHVAADLKHFKLPVFGITIDGHFLHPPSELDESYYSQKHAKKHGLLIGATKDDGSFLLPFFESIMTIMTNENHYSVNDEKTFHQVLTMFVLPSQPDPANQETILKLLEYIYINSSLPGTRPHYRAALQNIFTDTEFVCPMYAMMSPMLGTSDVYMYSFEHRSSVSPFPQWMGVVHASELDFVFGRPLDHSHLFTEDERQLSVLMTTAWANFAKFGNPNSADAPGQWPPLNNATYPYAVFRSPSQVSVEQGLRYRECVFWSEVYTALVNQHTPSDVHSHGEL